MGIVAGAGKQFKQRCSKYPVALVSSLPRYQRELDGLRAAGSEMIGYVRKSPPKAGGSLDSRIRLLQTMAERLKYCSHVARTYASAACRSQESLFTRDMPRIHDVMGNLVNVNGTTQGYLFEPRLQLLYSNAIYPDLPAYLDNN